MKKEEGKTNILMLIVVPILIIGGIIVGYFAFSNDLIAKKDLPNSSTNVSVSEESDKDSKIDRIEGIFLADIEGPNDSSYYVFYSDGKVSCEGNYTSKGTYTIENNKIKIKYDTIEGPDTDGEEKTDGEDELRLIDENTIDGYIKSEFKTQLVGKWSFRDAYDSNFKHVSSGEIFGSIAGKYGVGDLTFKDDGTYTNYIGAFSSEFEDDTEGTYEVSGDHIILKAKSGKIETLNYEFTEVILYQYNDYHIFLVKDDRPDSSIQIVGKWTFSHAYDKDNNLVSSRDIFGSAVGLNGVGDLTFKGDGTYTDHVGDFSSENDGDTEGTYEIDGNEVILYARSGSSKTIGYYASEHICYEYGDYYLWLVKDDSTDNIDTTSSTNDSTEKNVSADYKTIGTIEIPKTEVNDSIFESVTKYAMDNGFGYSYGPGLNEVGNSTLFVHGIRLYKNNEAIKIGDTIIINDESGRKYTYEVYDVHDIKSNDVAYMVRDTNGDVELSIQTGSQSNGTKRVILAKKVE